MSFESRIIFNPHSHAPREVNNEIRNVMIPYEELCNGSYFDWDTSCPHDFLDEKYPAIYKYLDDLGISSCLIKIDW